MAYSYPPLEDRPLQNTICLFDVDGTLTPARRVSFSPTRLPTRDKAREKRHERTTHIPCCSPNAQTVSAEMLNMLARLRNKVAIGFVGGSDLVKQQEQLGTADVDVKTLFDFCFAENGLTAYSTYPKPSRGSGGVNVKVKGWA